MFYRRDSAAGSNAARASLYQTGIAAFETGRYAEAIEALATVAETNGLPATLAKFYLGQAHMKEGVAQLQAGCFESAVRHLAAARTINPDSSSLAAYLAACHVGLNQFDMAAQEYERQCTDCPQDVSLKIRHAHALIRDGRHLRAVELLEEAIRVTPHRFELHFQLGLIHASNDAYPAATTLLEEAARLAPLDAAVQKNLGLTLGVSGRLDEAVKHLRIAQNLAPHDAHTAWLLALSIQAANPASATTLQRVKTPTAKAGDLDALGQIIIKDPEFIEAFISLPPSEIDGDVFAMLAGTLERALERHPDYADLHYHCSRVYARMGSTGEAIDRAAAATKLNPRYVQALIQLGKLYMQTDRGQDAIDRLNEAIAFGGDYPDVNFMLGELYREQGNKYEAVSRYRRALELNSQFGRAKEALDAVLAA
jgi:tetratricopeptide (TPR) repeat protein